jgi:tetratricopeptide (TPR) repeat protein
MRAPATSVRTTGDDFRPWEVNELATSNTNSSSSLAPSTGASGNSRTNWGTISYLANGRLITQQEYEAMLLANEAYELIRQEKYKMACDVLRRALGVCPDLPSAHTNLGLALAELGNTQEAIEQLKQAIALDPRQSAPWINLASSFQTEGNLHAWSRHWGPQQVPA